MKQFYEAYRDEAIVSALLRQLPWTHHLIILGQSKRPEEREVYLSGESRPSLAGKPSRLFLVPTDSHGTGTASASRTSLENSLKGFPRLK